MEFRALVSLATNLNGLGIVYPRNQLSSFYTATATNCAVPLTARRNYLTSLKAHDSQPFLSPLDKREINFNFLDVLLKLDSAQDLFLEA